MISGALFNWLELAGSTVNSFFWIIGVINGGDATGWEEGCGCAFTGICGGGLEGTGNVALWVLWEIWALCSEFYVFKRKIKIN